VGSLIQGKLEGGVIYTPAYLARVKVGAVRPVSKPVLAAPCQRCGGRCGRCRVPRHRKSGWGMPLLGGPRHLLACGC
jgi:hypothetical protein